MGVFGLFRHGVESVGIISLVKIIQSDGQPIDIEVSSRATHQMRICRKRRDAGVLIDGDRSESRLTHFNGYDVTGRLCGTVRSLESNRSASIIVRLDSIKPLQTRRPMPRRRDG